jgi:hypothetical protein
MHAHHVLGDLPAWRPCTRASSPWTPCALCMSVPLPRLRGCGESRALAELHSALPLAFHCLLALCCSFAHSTATAAIAEPSRAPWPAATKPPTAKSTPRSPSPPRSVAPRLLTACTVAGHTLPPEHRSPAPPASMARWPRVTSGRAERYRGCVSTPCYSAFALAAGVAPAGRPSWPRRRPLLPVPEDEGGHLLSSVSPSECVASGSNWEVGPVCRFE